MTDGSTTWTYTYNADGLRTKRTNGTTTYNYVYNGDTLSQMTVGSNSLYFAYDASGIPMSVTYNGATYYYVTNVQGDVIGILNSSGALVVSYTYDAWGNPSEPTGSLASTLGVHNPLRYRGYVYDSETKLYYLQSRYYNPEAGRFINSDGLISAKQGFLGNNLFTYCFNNPCRYIDPLGCEGIVGIGFQAELSTNCGMCGVEIVIYLDTDIVANTLDDENATFAIVIYSYSGISVDVGSLAIAPGLTEIASTLDLSELDKMTTDELLIALVALLSDFEVSGSVFVIYGYDNFVDADSYSGHFDTWALSFATANPTLSVGGYISYSDTCFVVGVKASVHAPKVVVAPKFEYSHTYYSKASLLHP